MSLPFIHPLLRLWLDSHVCLNLTVSIVDREISRLIRDFGGGHATKRQAV